MKFLAPFLLPLCVLSCRTSDSSKLKDVEFFDPGKFRPMACEKGELAFFVLTQSPGLKYADFEEVPLIASEEDFSGMVRGSEGSRIEPQIRLEVCTIGDKIELKRVVSGEERIFSTAYTPEEGSTIRGLQEMIFDSDYSKLLIDMPIKHEISDGKRDIAIRVPRLIIKGAKSKQAAITYTTISRFSDGELLDLEEANVGTFEFKEPIVNLSDGGKVPNDCKLNPNDPDRFYTPGPFAKKFPHVLGKGEIKIPGRSFTIKWTSYAPSNEITASNGLKEGVRFASNETVSPRLAMGIAISGSPSFLAAQYICKISVTDDNPILGSMAGKPITLLVPISDEERKTMKDPVRVARRHHDTGSFWWVETEFAVYSFGNRTFNEDEPFLADPDAESPDNAHKVTYLKKSP